MASAGTVVLSINTRDSQSEGAYQRLHRRKKESLEQGEYRMKTIDDDGATVVDESN